MTADHPVSAHGNHDAAPRLVLTGASNLTRGLSSVLGTARQRLELVPDRAMDAMIACGHGRSYVIDSTVMFRTLPAIRSSLLWNDLSERPSAPTFGLITDIGNDIMYDVPVPDIAAAIEFCLERMRERDARIAVTALPMASIRTVTPQRFAIVRRILFPSCRLTIAQAMERAAQLDDAVRTLASAAGASIIEPDGAWYGVDPIHIKMKHWPRAWRSILASWDNRPASAPPLALTSLRRWLLLKTFTPRHWSLFNHELARTQPAGVTADGTTVSLY